MPRKSDQSASRRKQSAVPESTADEKPKKAVKTANAKVKSASAGAAARKTTAKSAPAKSAVKKSPAKSAAKSKSAATKAAAETDATKPRKTRKKSADALPPDVPAAALTEHVEDPIGDLGDGEGQSLIATDTELEGHGESEDDAEMMEAYRAETATEADGAIDDAQEAVEADFREEQEPEGESEARPGAHLDRLQKILSQAGIASRRHAEEMIVAGRVMVNGQLVTQLGAKADLVHDHIRVDGKLIQGAERHRTFLLNKPKGFVTTVSDPEGRPTVMQFFGKMRERLYPVGRLDYQSEGLLLMTNDGELANRLTRAAAGVEKTYLVKVAGQPTEEQLDQLRGGVNIDREQAGSDRVQTAPASVRLVRPGDNPWYEVVLTEGRNRELRKMFQVVGHFVEKIRRVGYGPLVLDVEPGQFRELSAGEVNTLRLTAEGKLTPRRPKSLAMLPKEAGRAAEGRAGARPGARPARRPEKQFDRRGSRRGPVGGPPFRGREERSRPSAEGAPRGKFEGRQFGGSREGSEFRRREGQGFSRPGGDRARGEGPRGGRFERPAFKRGAERPRDDRHQGERPQFERPQSERPRSERSEFGRPGFDRGRGGRQESDRGEQRPGGRGFQPGGRGRQEGQRFGGRREFGGERPRFDRPGRFDKAGRNDRPASGRPERGRGEGFREERRSRPDMRPGFEIEEVRPGQPSRPPREDARRGGAERGGAPRPFGAPRFDRERGTGARGGAPQPGARRFGGSRPGGGGQRRGPGFGARPGGPRKPGFGGKPGGGPPRRGRG